MSLLNLVQGQRVFTQQIQHDLSASNVMINCDPRLKGPEGSSLDVKSRAGKIGVEDDICDLTVNNLTVKGTLTAKFDGSNLDGGTNYSDYLFYDNASKCFAVGGDQVHLGTNALAAQTTANLDVGQAADTIAIGNGAIANATGAASVNKDISGAIAIGKNAIHEIQGTTGATHTNVIAIGTNAMEKMGLQANSANIAIGSGAMRNGAGGAFHPQDGCIAIGENAMSEFTKIGSTSPDALTQSIAIGKDALRIPGTVGPTGGFPGNDVVAIGTRAGDVNCEKESVCIGTDAGKGDVAQGLSLKLRSVAIGHEASENGSGGNTVAIGYKASSGANGVSGAGSIAIGSGAGRAGQLGANSIAIGEDAASNNTLLGTANTIVINSTGVNLNTTGANSLVVATTPLSANGGLNENTATAAATIAKPTGTFTHYLVYSPTTGEIQMCRV